MNDGQTTTACAFHNIRRGDFLWCTKLHEHELTVSQKAIQRSKPDGTSESVNQYTIFGKCRPAMVLKVHDAGSRMNRQLVVWFTRSAERKIEDGMEVSRLTKATLPKRAFLKVEFDSLRRIPAMNAWCNPEVIDKMDQTGLAGLLEKLTKLGWSHRPDLANASV